MLVRCVYASRAKAPLAPGMFEAILEQSRKNNLANGITGLLCFAKDTFVQVLEGGRDEVSELFNTIVRDDRHDTVRLLVFEEIPQRQFASWTMGQINLDLVNPAAHPLPATLRAEDVAAPHESDRFTADVPLAPRTRERVRLPLRELHPPAPGRALDRATIRRAFVFHWGSAPGQRLYVGKTWLE